MDYSKILRREIEVAFAKSSQATWIRILKYAVLIGLMYCFGESSLFWFLLGVALLLALTLHFWYRYKTAGWTKSFGGWDYEKNQPKRES